MNLAVNTEATLLIVYRAWTHHKSVQSISRNKKSQVEAILLLFIESGALFAACQILNIVIRALDVNSILNTPVNICSLFFTDLYTISAAFSPVAIVILVQTRSDYEHTHHQGVLSSC